MENGRRPGFTVATYSSNVSAAYAQGSYIRLHVALQNIGLESISWVHFPAQTERLVSRGLMEKKCVEGGEHGGIFAFDATLAIMLRSCQKYVAICQTYFGCSLPDHFRQRRETDIANQKQQKQRPEQWNRQTFNTQKDKIIVVEIFSCQVFH